MIDDSSGYSDDAVDAGLDLHAGLKVLLTNWFGLFAEYRYTYVEPEFSIQGVDVEPQLSTHHVGVGVGFHF